MSRVDMIQIQRLVNNAPGGDKLKRAARRGSEDDVDMAYRMAAGALLGRATRVAEIGASVGSGIGLLRDVGLDAIDLHGLLKAENPSADAIGFGRMGRAADLSVLGECDAIVLVDVLGRAANDAVLLRALAHGVVPGTPLVGAVLRSTVGQTLAAPRYRGFSPESLDALLAQCGWSAPVVVGSTETLLVFETQRSSHGQAGRALELAAGPDAHVAETVIARLAHAAAGVTEAGEARELMLALGELHLTRGDLDLAEQAFTTANAIAPECARPFVALASVAFARGAEGDAEALWDHALGLDATNVAAWRGLASIFASRDESARALESLECAASLEPSNAAVATELSRALANSGDAPAAARALERVLSFGQASAELQASYCWLATAANRPMPMTMPHGGNARPQTGVHRVPSFAATTQRSIAS